ncbi:MAG TPA: hypothetical protein VG944_22175 [Fimbriimonas sp.]|nr:hypothetical protein [Fimbriimonas sp.]
MSAIGGRAGLLILAIGVGATLVKKSKPLANYLGDQLTKAGEFLKQGTEEKPIVVHEAASEPEAPIEAEFTEAEAGDTHEDQAEPAEKKRKKT